MTSLQLKRLEAYGFKSFADKIEIEFNTGITAVVGPNGSGKSNITDAIRWVLGEQNIRNLRGLKSEDIIFAGSVTRHASGVAEVSLVFDNDGELPVDFKEVQVTRRLFRSGESEFYINKARCRLKDIYELFADTGLGHDGMSVIGQNRMDEILNSKPEERRLFFEETAGITKYRTRKRESMRKLDETEQNLLRVTDIIHELAHQLGPMETQAEKTRHYNVLQQEYKDCRLTGIYRSYESLQQESEKQEQQKKECLDQEIGAKTAVQLAEARKEELAKKQLEIEKSMQALSEKNNVLRTRMEDLSSESNRLEERKRQLDAARVRILAQKNRLNEDVAGAEKEIVQLSTEKDKHQQELDTADERLACEKQKASALGTRIKAQKDAWQKLTEEVQSGQQSLMEKQNELSLLERDLQGHEENQAVRQQQQEEGRSAICGLQQESGDIAEQLKQIASKGQSLLEQRSAAEEERDKLAANLITMQQRRQELQQKQSVLQNKLHILKNMQQAYDGFGRSAKTVLASHEAWRSGVCGAVAELLEVPKQYITAIEIALGGSVQNVVTKDTDTARHAIEFLKRERAGRVTFLPLSSLVAHRPQAGPELRAPGILGYASNLVGVQPQYQKIADFLLGRTLVADTLEHGLALAKKQGHRSRIVTLEGELLNPGGSLSGGSRPHKEAGFLSRSGEINELVQQLSGLRQELPEIEQNTVALEEKQEACAVQLRQTEESLQQLLVHQAELRVSQEKLQSDLGQRTKALQELQAQAEVQQSSFAAAQQKRIEAVHALQDLETTQAELKNKLTTATDDLDDLEQDAEDLAKFVQDCSLKKVVLEQETLRFHERLLLRQRELVRAQEAIAKSSQEQKELEENFTAGGQRLHELQEQSQQLQAAYEAGTSEQKKLYEDKMAELVDSQDNDKIVRTASAALSKLQQKLHELELAMTEVRFRQGQCEETLREEYGLTTGQAAGHVMQLSETELKDKIQELKAGLEELGQVNPNAVAEYEAAQKRHAFIQQQSEDLIRAKENLVNILHEMDVKMASQFKSAFVKIDEYFREIFQKLFGGGKAELLLTDERNVLESGVDILVQLPDKKRQNLTALSGGERALTVIALLFSFLRYKPSPFSVLDEIDAPLDEANISRFCNFLRDFARNTQFIVVTHRKGTMEAADVMYGVTIEDAGASKVISVRLDEV